MHHRTSHRLLPSLLVLIAAATVARCGSSGSTTTAPSPVARCEISLGSAAGTVPATGGSGALTVTATRECAWSASVDGGWLSIRSGGSGQGAGTVEFAASPNPDPQTRTGAVIVNGTRSQISQAAGECVLTLDSSSSNFSPAGGSSTVQVRASSPLCSWTAASSHDWIAVSAGGGGPGNGSVTISVPATAGPPRAGSVTIAGQEHSVTQSQGCTYAVDNAVHAAPSAGGAVTVAVRTTPGCPWAVASNAAWITASPASGNGPGPVTLTIAGTQGPQRSGTVVIGGLVVTVTQSPGCSYAVEPEARTVGASGGLSSVRVSTADACAWSAVSSVPWITIQGASSGVGHADVSFSVAATTGPSRTGTLTVGGRLVTVTQAQGCDYAISSEAQDVPASGGSGTVGVTAGPGCAWTATSSAPWVTITAGASGTGNGQVQFNVAATSGPARSATVTIAGRTFTVRQGQGCSYALSSSSASVGNEGGARSFEVQAPQGCSWTASTTAPWISITSGASGSGTGTVALTVSANGGPDRTGTVTAGGQTFTVTQGAGCAYSLSADRQTVPASGGTGSVNVSTASGCAWTARSDVGWLTITSGASGTGDGAVGFTAAANAEAPRTGTLTIAGRTFTVEQSSGCTFSITPESRQLPASGGVTTTTVSAQGSCGWTTVANEPWISITSGANGTGGGTVQMSVAANSGAARSGTATIAGRTFTIAQDGGCTFSVAPESATSPASGGTVRISVTATTGCAWTTSSNSPWITVPQGAGQTGSGAVDLMVAANAGPARTGTATVAGRTVTITQASGCTITLSSNAQTLPDQGGSGTITVTAPAGCSWTAESSAGWLTVTSGASGSGDGTVGFTANRNPSGKARSATITIGGQIFTVSQ